MHIQGFKPSGPCIAFPLKKDNGWTGYPREILTPGFPDSYRDGAIVVRPFQGLAGEINEKIRKSES